MQGLCDERSLSVYSDRRVGLLESAALRRGKPHVRLNMTTRPIANKYREGKLQRTLKREFNRT